MLGSLPMSLSPRYRLAREVTAPAGRGPLAGRLPAAGSRGVDGCAASGSQCGAAGAHRPNRPDRIPGDEPGVGERGQCSGDRRLVPAGELGDAEHAQSALAEGFWAGQEIEQLHVP
jgi:hypothetical protein